MGKLSPDLLAQLAPAHAPAPAGWWPLAPGWWLIAFALAAAVAALIWLWRRPFARLRRETLRELRGLQSVGHDDTGLARGLELLMRRYAMARYGRETVAALSGSRWIAFVVARGGSAWDGGSGADLLRAAFGNETGALRAAPGAPDSAQRARWLAGARAFVRGRKARRRRD